jgi:hypothetical protein
MQASVQKKEFCVTCLLLVVLFRLNFNRSDMFAPWVLHLYWTYSGLIFLYAFLT